MRVPKIAYLANSEHVGGGNRSLLSMVQKVKEKGHEILIFVPAEGDFTSLLKAKNFQYKVVNHRLGQFSKSAFFLRLLQYIKALKSFSPDILHANDLYCYFIASFVAKILKVPIICHIRFSVEEESVKHYMRILPEVIIFNSYYMKNLFLNKNPDFSCSVRNEVVYNFFDPSEYYCPQQREILRERWRVGDCFLVGMIGNFSPQKGHDTYLYMAKKLLKSSCDFRFVIVGKDLDPSKKNEERIKKLIKSLSIEDYIIWLGYQKDVGKILSALDVLVVPSIYEPFGRVAVEGLLAGLPVVASRTGGLIEILEDAPYGFLVDRNNYNEFANIVRNIKNKKLSFPLVDNRNYAISRFGIEANLKLLMKLYDSLIGYGFFFV